MRKTPPVASTPRTPADNAALRTWLSVASSFYLCEALMARRLGALGVRTAEHEILANLRSDPGIGQQVLAARCFSAKSHISALLTTLEERGWVRREPDPADARAKRLFLTPPGERMALKTAAVQAELVAGMCATESVRSLVDVKDVMLRVGERLQAMLDETPAK